MSRNSRMSSTQISKEVGLSRDAISYRVNNLTKSGVIQGYRTV